MKKVLLSLVVFMSTTAVAQVLGIASVEKVNLPSRGGVVAGISPKGDYILLSDGNLSGLVKYDLASGKTDVISTARSAGLDVQISLDGQSILYREDKYEQKLRKSAVMHKNLKTGILTQVVAGCRNLNAMSVQGGKAMAIVNGELSAVKSVNPVGTKTLTSAKSLNPIASSCNGQLVITVSGVSNIISPNGAKHTYIWPSISPNGKKVLYHVSGVGTFVCDLNGHNVKKIGLMRAPVWYDNNTIVGMMDKDDGYVITSSSIVAATLDGKYQTLTDGSMISMYPYASSESKKIAFSTLDGEAYIINIK